MKAWRILGILLLAAALCGAPRGAGAAEPSNLGELKTQIRAYQLYGGYERDLVAVAAQAQAYIESRAHLVTKPVLILDIDETSLSNLPEIMANDFGFILKGECDKLPEGPCGDEKWESLGRATAIAPTLALFKAARAAGVAVIFITGREEKLREATEKNLTDVGYVDRLKVVMRPTGVKTCSAADYKKAERERIEKDGYTIIANVGDQPSDLAGGFAERAFLMPNPFYRIP